MSDNDNDPLSDAEKQLVSFIQSVRPESGPLLKLRTAAENWLWWGKLCATICAVAVFQAVLIDNWYGLSALWAIIGASAPALMILSLERVLGHWRGRLSFERGHPAFHWHFERACT